MMSSNIKLLSCVLISTIGLFGCNKANVWSYSERIDEVRSNKIYLASIPSNNNDLEIVLEQKPQEAPNVKLSLNNNEYSCNTSCYAVIKVGNNEQQTLKLSSSSKNTAFIQDKEVARALTKSLEKANSMTIELPLQNNKQQFTFTLPPLKLAKFTPEEIKKANKNGADALVGFVKMWDSKLDVVSSTPRIGLLPVVLDLQKTSKEIDAIEVSDCLAPAKEAHKIYMQERINLIIQFMNGNDNVTEYEGLNKGDKSILEYSLIMLRCTK